MVKSQIPNPKSQTSPFAKASGDSPSKLEERRRTNPKSQFPKFSRKSGIPLNFNFGAGQTKKFRSLVIWSLVIIWNLVLGNWNFSFAQDKIVAIVNNDIITQKDLNDFMNFMRIQLSGEYAGRELEEQIQIMKLDLLNKLIEDRLILQEAKKNNIKIDENRVKAKINEIKSRYPLETEFQNALTRQGLVQADIEAKIREQLLMYYIVEQKVREKIVVRPEEVTAFYNTNKKEFAASEERELEVITLENENLAKTFADNLKKGEKLEDLAAKYPITLNQLRVLQGEELRKDIEEIVFNLKIGEISHPVSIDDKYYIFKLNNITPPKQLNLSEVQDKINAFLFERKFQEELKNWLDELKKKSYIKIL